VTTPGVDASTTFGGEGLKFRNSPVEIVMMDTDVNCRKTYKLRQRITIATLFKQLVWFIHRGLPEILTSWGAPRAADFITTDWVTTYHIQQNWTIEALDHLFVTWY
jgi:hypothetical protein